MKKIFIFITTLSILILPGLSTFAAPGVCVDQDVYKFDSVPEGTIIKHEFIIKNMGDEPLLISQVVTG